MTPQEQQELDNKALLAQMGQPAAKPAAQPQSVSAGMFDASQPPPADPNSDMVAQPEQDPSDPFIGSNVGHGVKLPGGEWVPWDHPLAATAAAPPPSPAAPSAVPPPPAAPAPAPAAASPSAAPAPAATPGAAPAPADPNQALKDTVKNTYLQQATQGTQVDTNDANFRQQADTFAAAQERALRNKVADDAEQYSTAGMAGSGAQTTDARMARENAARNTGTFEAQLVGSELANKRNEIARALQGLGGMIDSEEGRALQREMLKVDEQLKLAGMGMQRDLAGNEIASREKLAAVDAQLKREGLSLESILGNRGLDNQMTIAQLDAALKRAGIDMQGSLGRQELGLKEKLGMGSLNLEGLRMLMQDQQFGDSLGFNIADREAYYNNQALQNLF